MYVTVYSPNEKGVWFNEKGCGFAFGRSRRQLSTKVQCSGAGSLAAGRSLEVAVAVVRRFKMLKSIRTLRFGRCREVGRCLGGAANRGSTVAV